MKNKTKRNFKRILIAFAFVLVFTFAFNVTNVFSQEYGQGDYCLTADVDFENGFSMENISSIKVNGNSWTSNEDIFRNSPDGNNNLWTIQIIAGMNGELYPQILTPGESDSYLTYTAIPNPDDTDAPDDDFILTLTHNTNWSGKGDGEHCGFIGVRITEGPPIETPSEIVASDVSITISGDELEYHYDSEHLDEADVAYFKFDINGGTDEARLVPFTFRNAQYTYNDGEPPKNVSSVTTKQPIHYEYPYNGSGTVEFCVNGGGTDEYTHIYINGTDYGNQAPHTKVQHFETMDGWAQKFCIHDVPYSNTYVVSVTGENTAAENRIPGFGWNYLSADRSEDITPETEGNFAHGRLEFVSATYTVDGTETITINNANDFNNYRYHGTGQIFQWYDGNKEYPEEERWRSWGSAQLPYGTTLTVRIVPDKGYQLTGLATNSNGFQATETPGVYTITLADNYFAYDSDKNVFDLNPTFTQVGAEVRADSVNVRSGVIQTNQAVENGSLKLEVNDTVSMSQERRESFEGRAEEEGYEIENYLDISLYNSIYKGGKKDNADNYLSWDTEVNNLSEDARITLELEQNMEGKDITLIHERRDGQNYTYEVIPVNYNSQTNSISFETRSFSDYAIAVRNIENNNSNNNNNTQDIVTVSFNTNGGSNINPIEIEKGNLVGRPQDPSKDGMVFEDWYIDEAFNDRFDFNTPINNNITLFANWTNANNTKTYTVRDEQENEIIFTEESNHNFHLYVIDYLSYSKEEVMTMGNITSKEYDEIFESLKNGVKKYGDLVGFYEIEVYDENDHNIEKPMIGKFKIRIKITPEIKKYNTFKLLFVADDFSMESPITLIKNGDYYEGTLEHLSKYVLVGSNTKTDSTNSASNPPTGDNVYIWIGMLIISILGLFFVALTFIKSRKSKEF